MRHCVSKLACWSAFAVIALTATATPAQKLTAYTEQWAPYNYEESGEIKGIATDMLQAACTVAKLSCSMHLVPWARAYKIVRYTENTILYTTARKASREKDFLWVGPILPRSTWVYTRTANDKVAAVGRDITQLRFGIVRDEASQQDLINAGLPAQSLIEDNTNATVLRLLLSNVVDAMVDTEVSMAWNLRTAGLPASTVTKLSKLSEGGAYYFALNPKTHPEIAARLQTALDKLQRQGKLEAIIRSYDTPLRVASDLGVQ